MPTSASHPDGPGRDAGNLEPGDIVFLPDGREALVTARVEAVAGPLAGLLEVVVAPSPLDADDALP
jgi:hypothetical protein